MRPVGFQEGSEGSWWWKVAMHLDQAQIALVNAMPHNVDDPRPGTALHTRLCEAQAILLDIMGAKRLIPRAPPPQVPQVPQVTQASQAPQGPHMHVPAMSFSPKPPTQVQMPIMSEPAVPADMIDREFGEGAPKGVVSDAADETTNGHGELVVVAEDVAAAVDEVVNTTDSVVEAAERPAVEDEPAPDLAAQAQLVPAPGLTTDEKSAG